MPRFGPAEKIGCGTIGILGFAVLCIASLTIRTYQNPYYAAERAAAADPCSAAKKYAEIVRQDTRGWSARAIDRLCEMDAPCSLDELIGLMDVADGHYVDQGERAHLASGLRAKASVLARGVEPPPYNPAAPQSLRAKQKAIWVDWLRVLRGSRPEEK